MSGSAAHDSALVFKVSEQESISEDHSVTVPVPTTVTSSGDLGLTQAHPSCFVAVYGTNGRLVRESRTGQIAPGLSSGVYFVRVESPNGTLTRKVVLTR
jgi:hypothetical protein